VIPKNIDQINWTLWKPVDRATLLFVIDGNRVLLMKKKRGLGAGKINAPGGRLHPGEAPLVGARREVIEELEVTPERISKQGELSFQFVDGYSIFVHVFSAHSYTGVATETDEASPRWTERDAIPYSEMWADDAFWVPILLRGGYFEGRFVFDKDLMLGQQLVEISDPRQLPWGDPSDPPLTLAR
jgi:8-oxo-dGTP diphosphatase